MNPEHQEQPPARATATPTTPSTSATRANRALARNSTVCSATLPAPRGSCLAGIVPALAPFRESAEASFAAARDRVTELAGRAPVPLYR
ncbi:hypothetical protein AB0N87_12035 [Streptomyces sp. NPDC093228]|uniref:hypothetical protein n=1 Tax=Streptomyces sp. NPDC093228 TaxID=3155070 RepID=UPI00343934D8